MAATHQKSMRILKFQADKNHKEEIIKIEGNSDTAYVEDAKLTQVQKVEKSEIQAEVKTGITKWKLFCEGKFCLSQKVLGSSKF